MKSHVLWRMRQNNSNSLKEFYDIISTKIEVPKVVFTLQKEMRKQYLGCPDPNSYPRVFRHVISCYPLGGGARKIDGGDSTSEAKELNMMTCEPL